MTVDTAPPFTPVVTGPTTGRAVWHMGALMVFHVSSEQSNGAFWLAEQTSLGGYASPLHVHSREDETFHVLEGRIELELGGEPVEVGPGETVFAPRDVPHAYRVLGDRARWLVLGTPGGFDGWFHETGEPAETLTVPSFDLSRFPDFGEVAAAVARYGGQVLGPPRA